MNKENYEAFFGKIDEGELAVVELETDEQEILECAVIAVFSAPPFEYEYIALMEIDEEDEEEDEEKAVIIMRYIEDENGDYDFEPLEEVELKLVTEVFHGYLNDVDFEKMGIPQPELIDFEEKKNNR